MRENLKFKEVNNIKVTIIDELRHAIENSHYEVNCMRPKYLKDSHVIDEDKSVKWNREEIQRLNEAMKVKINNNRKE